MEIGAQRVRRKAAAQVDFQTTKLLDGYMASIIVWDIETVPDLKGFAVANAHEGKSDDEVRVAMGDKFPNTSTTRSSALAP